MPPVEPLLIINRFPPLHIELLALLNRLHSGDWSRPTVASGWTVRDMVAHLLDTDIRRLSFQRDRLAPLQPGRPVETYEDLVEHINQINAQWITAARRLSPAVLIDFLTVTGPQVYELFRSLDPFAPAGASVAWAGERQSPNWFDIAREYTEKWMHQQQVRDAVGAPGLTGREWLHPVLDTFMRGLPHTFREMDAPVGTAVEVAISGEAGDIWHLRREEGGWALFTGRAGRPAARLELDQDIAWRLFTKGIDPEKARSHAHLEGDQNLAVRALSLVTIMA